MSSTTSEPIGTGKSLRARARLGVVQFLLRVENSSRLLWLAVFLPLAVLYLGTIQTGWFDLANDPQAVGPAAWNVAHNFTSRFPVAKAPEGPSWLFWLIPSGPGMLTTNREPGLVWLATPFFFVNHHADLTSLATTSIAAALTTAGGVATLSLMARRLVSGRTALAVGYVAGTATTLWAVAARALWPHGPDTLYLALAMVAASRGRALATGSAFFPAILTRPILAAAGAVVGLWEGWVRRSLRHVVLVAVPQVAAVAVLWWYSHEFWGGGVLGNYTAANAKASSTLTNVGLSGWRDFGVNIAGTLVSPSMGIFVHASFLIPLVFGLRSAWRVAPDWARAFGIASVVYTVVQLKANRFSGGVGFWSYRYAIEPLVLAAPLLVLAWREWTCLKPKRRGAFAALLVVSLSLQILGAMSYRQPYPQVDYLWNFKELNVALYRLPFIVMPIVLFGTFLLAFFVYVKVSRTPLTFEPATSPAAAEDADADAETRTH